MSDASESWTFQSLFIVKTSVRKVQRFCRSLWNHMISICVKCFSILCQKFIRTSVGLLIILHRPLPSESNLSLIWTASKIRCETTEFSGIGLSNLGVFCFVYAREFSFFTAFWYFVDWSCSIVVSIARNQNEIGFNILLWNNG